MALKNNLWQNSKEIEGNLIDDDNNGYVDDKYGWNFLGNKNGKDVADDTMEVVRTYKKYKDIFDGPNSEQNKTNIRSQSKAFDEYQYAKDKINGKVEQAKQNSEGYKKLKAEIPQIFAILKGKNLSTENLKTFVPTDVLQYRYHSILQQIAQQDEYKNKTADSAKVIFEEELNEAIEHFDGEIVNYDIEYNSRTIIGDDETNLTEKGYGNNHYEGPDALHGTHVSGIIAGQPTATEPQYGVAYKVAKIMSVRAVPNGDERDKDIANAIIYAVDNGAKVINMSFGKAQSPNKERVWEAFKYAQKHNVLLVKAAGNENEDLNKHLKYPANYISQDALPIVNNFICVGASTNTSEHLKANFSNYNHTMVDVFAPGEEIYASVPDNKYKYLKGTSMAAPVVAGAAAVLMAYIPNLSAVQAKEALEKTVNANPKSKDFGTYSQSGGVIDLYKAAVYAYNNFYNKTKK
jgi:subtilisin family serine protease